MKLKSLVLFILIAAAGAYIYQDRPLQQKLLGNFHQVAPELNRSTLYKWQNSKGEWQITDTPPAKDIPFTTVSSKDQVNVIPGQNDEDKK